MSDRPRRSLLAQRFALVVPIRQSLVRRNDISAGIPAGERK